MISHLLLVGLIVSTYVSSLTLLTHLTHHAMMKLNPSISLGIDGKETVRVRLSTRGRYGVKAMIELACCQNDQPIALRQIAQRQGLSEHYLEQLFSPLRKAGLVRSIRGSHGGYVLARDPGEITIGDILRILEGPLAPTECASSDSKGLEHCGDGNRCLARSVWARLETSISDVVDSITLLDLIKEAEQEKQRHMYYI